MKETGICDVCEDGKYDKANGCKTSCPKKCGVADKCSDNGNCLKTDGVITCKTTANWGPKCEKKCNDGATKGCKDGCKNVGDDPATYKCEGGCKEGYSGENCVKASGL